MNRNFYLLWQGQLVSLVATQIFRLGLVVWLAQAAQSATLLALLMATFAVPGLVIGPLGGVLVDRYPRRRILIACDIVRGVAVLSVGIVWLVLPRSHPASIGALFVLAAIVGSTTAVFQPATIALVPELVAGPALARANSLVQSSFQVAGMAAQSFGAVSFRLAGASVLAFVNAASYFYSAASAFFISAPPAPRPAAPAGARPSFSREFREALSYVRSTPGLPALMALNGGLRFFVAPFAVLFPFYVVRHLRVSFDWYGFLVGGMGLGAIAGMAVSSAIRLDPRRNAAVIIAALVVQSLLLTALAVAPTPYAALALVAGSGVLNGFIGVRLTTILQLAIAPGMRGRVFGVYRTVTEGLTPIATILAGIVADLTGRNVPLIYAGCGGVLTVIALAYAASAPARAFLAGAPAAAAPPRPAAPPEAAVTAGVGR